MNRLEFYKTARQSGFTLLELMITIALLAVISLGIYQGTTQAFKLREVLTQEGDFYNGIRLAMAVLEKDIAQLYSPTLLLPDAPRPNASNSPNPMVPTVMDPNLQQLRDSPMGRANTFWGAVIHMTGIRPMRFVGQEKKLTFVASSRRRIYKEVPESEFSKIQYELKPDPSPDSEELKGTLVLYKTESPNAFSEDDLSKDKMKTTAPILYGIKTFKFRFYRANKQQWLNQWDTESFDLQGLYPDIVEAVFEVIGPARLRFDGIYRFKPEVPLNGLPSTT